MHTQYFNSHNTTRIIIIMYSITKQEEKKAIEHILS
jgi:hypothetical protein